MHSFDNLDDSLASFYIRISFYGSQI
jgi:hypothetical protein